jgi:hypothetical protein
MTTQEFMGIDVGEEFRVFAKERVWRFIAFGENYKVGDVKLPFKEIGPSSKGTKDSPQADISEQEARDLLQGNIVLMHIDDELAIIDPNADQIVFFKDDGNRRQEEWETYHRYAACTFIRNQETAVLHSMVVMPTWEHIRKMGFDKIITDHTLDHMKFVNDDPG